MAGKKKNMDGGRLFGLLPNKPSGTINELNNSNIYLSIIKKLAQTYQNIKPNNLSVNNLNTKVKSLIKFSETIKNKKELTHLLEQVKRILIQKLFEKLGEYNAIFQNYDSYNFSQLLSLLQDFEKLTDQINLLGGSERNNLGSLKIKKIQFIATMLNKYEEEILSKLQRNSNSQIELLKKEVEDYISKYSQFTVEIGTKRGANNSINSIVHRLSKLFEKIEQFISQQNTSQNRSQQLNSQQPLYGIRKLNIPNEPTASRPNTETRSQQNKIARFISVLENLNYDLNTNRMNKITLNSFKKVVGQVSGEINENTKKSSEKILGLLTSINSKISHLNNIEKQKTQQPQFQNSNTVIHKINSPPNNNLNYHSILARLEQRYPHKVSDFGNLPTLAIIASNIESIKKMEYGPERKSIIKKLQDKISKFKNTLGKYPEFQEYEEFAYPQ